MDTAYQAVQRIYNATIRDFLPRRWRVADDITIRTGRLFDTSRAPEFEKPLREGVQTAVEGGDTVVVIGGGFGSSTVEAAREAGSDGEVIVYEAVSEQLSLLKQTIRANHTPAAITVCHARVGPVSDQSQNGFGEPDGDSIQPSDLPSHDVSVLDCEGAEDAIVPVLESERAVVETHAWGELDVTALEDWDASFVGAEGDVAKVWQLTANGA